MEINNILNNLSHYKEILFSKKIELNGRVMYFVYEASLVVVKDNVKNAALNPLGLLIKENESSYIKFFKEKYKVKNSKIMDKFEKEEN